MWGLVGALIIIGIMLIILEMLVLQGVTVAGFLGIVLMGIGVYMSYSNISIIAGHYTLAISIAAFIIILIFSLRSKTWKKAMLNTSIDSSVNLIGEDEAKSHFIGKECKTLTRLNPIGKVLYEDAYYEAKSYNNIIEPNTNVIITNIEGNTLIVKQKNK